MAELLQLDKAAVLTGKSEVTLRRLIKAGKIPFQKEKTLTGFVYMIDPDKVKAYYHIRDGGIFSEAPEEDGHDAKESFEHAEAKMGEPTVREVYRVAVAGESGSAQEYWQKKSELYEDRYNEEITKHSQTREELGMWRGRAEQAQTILTQLLPVVPAALSSGEEQKKEKEVKKETANSGLSIFAVILLMLLVCILVGAVVYFKYT